MTFRPSIDHSILSPSGRVSKRARAAAMKRASELLFPPEFQSEIAATRRAQQPTKAESLRQHAARLRDLAERGMKPRAYLKEAIRCEAEAAALESSQ